MRYLKKSGFLKHIFKSAPLIILFIAVLNEFDANYFGIPFLSVNLAFILIFFWTLKNIEQFGYGYIFLAGIINDVVQNFPIGISSINYMLLCSFALFIRARTLLPNLLYDWGFFIIAILIISSLHYSILTIVFDIPIRYGTLMFSSVLTFLVYPLFSKLFNQIYLIDLRQENAK